MSIRRFVENLALPDLAPSDGEPAVLQVGLDGKVSTSATKVSTLKKLLKQSSLPLFDVWAVPPSNMNVGKYTITNWQDAQPVERDTSTPIPSVVLHYYDQSAGALNKTSGILTIPESGSYRHSVCVKSVNRGDQGSLGITLRINGSDTMGKFFLTTGDGSYGDMRNYTDEHYHEAGDTVQVVVMSNTAEGTDGVYSKWTVTRISTA